MDPAFQLQRGQRTLIQTLIQRAQDSPDEVFGSIPVTSDIHDGFHDFTVRDLVCAIDACAWTIKEHYGVSTEHETLLYMGASDFRYTIVLFAAIKCGYKVVQDTSLTVSRSDDRKVCFQNPNNPKNDNLSILEHTGCIKALHSCEMRDLVLTYQASRPSLQTFEIPPLIKLLAKIRGDSFPFEPKTWEESKYDPIAVLHSSGTTGNPKPIVIRNGFVKAFDVEWQDGSRRLSLWDREETSFHYAPFPAFHLGGLLLFTVVPTLAGNCAMVQPPPDSNPGQNPALTIDLMCMKNVKTLTAPPRLLEALARTEAGIQGLSRLDAVPYGGGPLGKELGDTLIGRGVHLHSIYGATEAGWLLTLAPEQSDWEWLHFHPDLQIDWQHHGEGVYELCFADQGIAQNELRGTHWTLLTDIWRSKDLFVRHVQKPHLWKFVGRQDDMLLLSHGDMINPTPLEDVVRASPRITGTLVGGQHRAQPCLLLETLDNVPDHASFLREIWSEIEDANSLLRKDRKILPSHVAVVGPNSFVRSPKGSIVRGRTIEKFARQIEALYCESG